jgi:hypothetical protein
MFTIDINKDNHRILIGELSKASVGTKIVRNSGALFTLDTLTYEDYVKAKDIQVQLDKQYSDIPCI